MRKINFVFGFILAALGVLGIFNTLRTGQSLFAVAATLVVELVGVILLLAAFRDFRGHWALPVGLIMLASPVVVVFGVLDQKESFRKNSDAIISTSVAAVLGSLLLVTAKHFDTMSKMLESRSNQTAKPVHESAAPDSCSPPH